MSLLYQVVKQSSCYSGQCCGFNVYFFVLCEPLHHLRALFSICLTISQSLLCSCCSFFPISVNRIRNILSPKGYCLCAFERLITLSQQHTISPPTDAHTRTAWPGRGSVVAPRDLWVHTCRSCVTYKHKWKKTNVCAL